MTARGAVQARALVTSRIHPIHLDGQVIHQVGLPYHWGYKGLVKGDVTNDLIALSEEPNVRIMETKALLCNVLAGKHGIEGDNRLAEGNPAAKGVERKTP